MFITYKNSPACVLKNVHRMLKKVHCAFEKSSLYAKKVQCAFEKSSPSTVN